MKEISKEDWGRKEWFNILFLGFGMLSIVVGTKNYTSFGGFEGVFVAMVGVTILMYQQNFLFKLIKEKENKK